MKSKVLLISVLLIVGITSCRTVEFSEMSPTGRIPQLLPPLEAKVDVWSLESVLGATVTSGSVSDFGFYESVSYANPMIRDLVTLYERDMRNITEEYGVTRGVAMCRLVDGEVGASGLGWAYLSGLTLFIPNVFGMPILNIKASMQLEMSIFDGHGMLVGRYTSDYHRRRVPVALYHGYGSDASLKATIDVFKACMIDIKGRIELDFNRLNGALGSVTYAPFSRAPEASGTSGASSDSETLGDSGMTREPFLREDW